MGRDKIAGTACWFDLAVKLAMRSRTGVAVVACAFAFLFALPGSRGQTLPDRASRNAPRQDSKVCASCHPSVWATYRRTGMARSFYRPTPDNTVEDYAHKN